MRNTKIIILILLVVLIMIPSCQQDGHSVFWAVINDEEEVDWGLDNSLTILGVVETPAYYVIASKSSLWMREVSQNTASQILWTSVALPQNLSMVTAMVSTGTQIYLATLIEDNSGAEVQYLGKLYSASIPGGPEWAATPGWSEVASSVVGTADQITNLFYVNSILFASVFRPNPAAVSNPALPAYINTFYYLGADFTTTGINDVNHPVTTLQYDGANYWAVTKDAVYSGPYTAMVSNSAIPTTSGIYSGYHYSAAHGAYYLSTSAGEIFRSADAVTWEALAAAVQTESNKNVYFTRFSEVNGNVIVGTYNYGFYEMTDGALATLARQEAELVSDLNRSSILAFHISGNVVLFQTSGAGLYRNEYTTQWSSFIHE